MKKFYLSVCAMAALFGCGTSESDNIAADYVYHNALIWTGNPEQPWATGMAIKDGRISAIGKSSFLEHTRNSNTKSIDLKGQFVTPGFQDSHIHVMYGPGDQVDLAGAETLIEIQERIVEFAGARPELPWITGFGWAYSAFPNQRPLASHLDTVIKDRPVFMRARDGHMALANTKAMQLASINGDSVDPENGHIVKTGDGYPTGELRESATNLIQRLIPPPTAEAKYQALLNNMKVAAAAGITAFHEAGVSPTDIAIFQRAEAEGQILQRVELAARMVTPEDRHIPPLDAAKTHIAETSGLRSQLSGPYVRLRSIKGMLDGTIDAATAAMYDNFEGTETAGIPFWEQPTLNTIVTMYDAAGFQVILHAIGDRAIAEALNSFEHAKKSNGARDSRHRVEHAEMPRIDDLERFHELGVIASTQPMFAYPDSTVLENFAVLLGHERAQYADNFAIWDDAGVRQIFGSDNPVMTLSVLKGIEVAVTRMTENGSPAGGWYPKGRITAEAALRHYTSDSAWGIHDDHERGTLEVGKFADFVVLSENILEIDPTRISETLVLKTIMNGRITYDNDAN